MSVVRRMVSAVTLGHESVHRASEMPKNSIAIMSASIIHCPSFASWPISLVCIYATVQWRSQGLVDGTLLNSLPTPPCLLFDIILNAYLIKFLRSRPLLGWDVVAASYCSHWLRPWIYL